MDDYIPGMAGPLKPPKNGHRYEFLVSARVSDPREGKQDERSLEDQEFQARALIKQMTSRPVNVTVIAGSGSGELLTRTELIQLKEAIRTAKFDVVLAEDLGRIARDVESYHFCGLCEDYETRLIALNNSVDTLDPNYRDAAFFASYFYQKENREKSRRIKERKRSRFQAGGDLPDSIFGYIKPKGAKHESQMSKDPLVEWVCKEWFRKLDEGATFAEIADWLNANRVPQPPHARGDKWTGTMVGRHTYNPILKGRREHNNRKTRRRNDTGEYVSVKAEAEELLWRDVPHLAFFEPAYYDRVVGKVRARNAKFRRKSDGVPGHGIARPTKRVRFPGGITECGICGYRYVFGGHGQADHLMCDGARHYVCWNGVTVDGPLAAQKVSAAVFTAIEQLEDFDPAYLATLKQEAEACDIEVKRELARLDRELQTVERHLGNVLSHLREHGSSAAVKKELADLEAKQARLAGERSEQLEWAADQKLLLPSLAELKQIAREAFKDRAGDDGEFARCMRTLIPRLVVFPVRLCDGGRPVLRAMFRLHLAHLLPDKRQRQVLDKALQRVLTVDLFESPQREQYRQQVVAMRKSGMAERQVARELGITATAAQRAAALQRRMNELGVTDPYVSITEPPEDIPKMRRHKHKRYRFTPLDHAGEI